MIQDQLRALLKEKGWTQKELSERLGRPLKTVESWFAYKQYRRPCVKDLERIAEMAGKKIVFVDENN